MTSGFRKPLAFLAAVVIAGCERGAPAQNDLVAISVQRAAVAPAAAAYAGPGTVESARTFRLAFEIPGRVVSVAADVGDRVGAGEVLASLDSAQYAESYDAARAQAAAALAQAHRALAGSRPQDIAQAQAQVARARAADDLAVADAHRARTLFTEGAIAAQDYDTAVQAERDTAGALAAARAQASLAREGPRVEDRTAAVASSSAAQAQAALAATTLAKTSLVAPADAFVQERSIEVGDTAEPGAVAFVLSDAAAPLVYVDVPERMATSLRRGDGVTIDFAGSHLAGRIVRIEPVADPQTRTTQVRVAAPELRADPGAVVNVRLGREDEGGIAVPLGAVMATGGGTYVECYDPTRATVRKQRVRLVSNDGDRAIVFGIAPGTPVVVAGQYEAIPGQPVRVVPQEGSQ